jgi:hypothetical protein
MTTPDRRPHTGDTGPLGPARPRVERSRARRYRGRFEAAPSRDRIARNRLVAVVVLMLFAPGILYATGVRAVPFENRRLASFPRAGAGWSYLSDLSNWATDNLPLRKQGVQASNWIDQNLFDDPPASNGGGASPVGAVPAPAPSAPWAYPGYPEVVRGKSGQLFYGGDFAELCQPTLSVDTIMSAIQQLASAVQNSGRRFELVVAPDKSTILSTLLPNDPVGANCRADRVAQLYPRLKALPYNLDLGPALESLATTSTLPVYLKADSHWDGPAAATWAQKLVATLNPAATPSLTWQPQRTSTGTSDLSVLIGTPMTNTAHPITVASPQVRHQWTAVPAIDETPRDYLSTGPPNTLIPGACLLVGDSFTLAARGAVPGVFANLTELHANAALSDPSVLVDQMVDSDTVILESVQREFYSGDSPLFNPAFIAAATKALAANPR